MLYIGFVALLFVMYVKILVLTKKKIEMKHIKKTLSSISEQIKLNENKIEQEKYIEERVKGIGNPDARGKIGHGYYSGRSRQQV